MSWKMTGSLSVAIVLLAMSPLARSACPHKAERSVKVDAAGISTVEINATSGELRIRGDSDPASVIASGRACAWDPEDLERIQILTRRSGDRLQIIAGVPFAEGDNESRIGYLDLSVRLPDSLPLEVSDSSGDIDIRGVSSLMLSDSSGDIELEGIRGETLITRDSSGDIRIRRTGPVTIRIDSSGDIHIDDAESVIVDQDTSGDILVTNIRGDVTVGTDSSGSIRARSVGGNFTVGQDSTGGIDYEAVSGRVSLPENRR